jgi:hypothetical protein
MYFQYFAFLRVPRMGHESVVGMILNFIHVPTHVIELTHERVSLELLCRLGSIYLRFIAAQLCKPQEYALDDTIAADAHEGKGIFRLGADAVK